MNTLTQTELILNQPQPLDQNPAAVYIASLRAETCRITQAQALRLIARILDADYDHLNWGALRYRHTAAIHASLAQVYSPTTANKILSALRQTLKQAQMLGQMTAEDYRLAIELEPITGESLPIGRELSTGEILALITTCQQDPNTNAGTRDAAMIGLIGKTHPQAGGFRINQQFIERTITVQPTHIFMTIWPTTTDENVTTVP